MLGNPAAATVGLVFTLMMILIFISSVRRSPFGWLIISVEYFYILGLGVYPLLASLGVVSIPETLSGYESINGKLELATFVHIFLYGVGALIGYFFARRFAKKVSKKVVLAAIANKLNNYTLFYLVSGFSIFISVLYFSFVGLETALLNANASRGGNFLGFVGLEQFLFLKTLARVGVFSMVFIPFIIVDGRRVFSTFLIVTTVAISLYIETVSRGTILEMIGVFLILYLSLKRGVGSILLAGIISAFLIFIFIYGKTFVAGLSAYLFLGMDFELVRHGANGDDSAYFFSQFGHLAYSIDAGVRNFFTYGPILPEDILLSPIGVVPSSLFSSVGLDFLSYQLVSPTDRLSCINTAYFTDSSECSFPPYFTGYSAYFLPFVGAFLFGFARFWFYSVIENCWLEFKVNPEFLWFPVFLFIVANELMLVISNTISFAVFVSLVLWFLLKMKKVLLSVRTKLRSRFPV
ncbi:hypothetical protein COW64_24440 [bacterium (Candidatus Blackallbacteria) CG18_big_fil_WC_8_21_14_2_50_49_26]|nr:MAG: hypothetical protein COW64_24440 [bacterium (Candidatus Blackallbacteria) CG18_big_fil_WC_8_21_14_2_50_49_26]